MPRRLTEFEFQGKEYLDGLKFLAGPEVYWGANPKFMLKYEFDLGNNEFAFIHAEDVARKDDSASATAPTQIQTRQTTLIFQEQLRQHNARTWRHHGQYGKNR